MLATNTPAWLLLLKRPGEGAGDAWGARMVGGYLSAMSSPCITGIYLRVLTKVEGPKNFKASHNDQIQIVLESGLFSIQAVSMLEFSIFREGMPCERCCGKGEAIDPNRMNSVVRHLISVYGKEGLLGRFGVSTHTLKAYMTGAREWPDHVVKKVLELMKGSS